YRLIPVDPIAAGQQSRFSPAPGWRDRADLPWRTHISAHCGSGSVRAGAGPVTRCACRSDNTDVPRQPHRQAMSAGTLAEQRAERYLQSQGLGLIERNYRSRFGEIDLIMRDGTSLVFVEVRMRRNKDFGGAAASIDVRKQQRIIRTAHQYLADL